MNKLKDLYKKDKGAFPDPILNVVCNYTDKKGMFDATAVAKAMNGYFLEDVTVGDKIFKKGECVPGFAFLQADGKTSCGIWIYSGSFTAGWHQPHDPQEKGRSHGPRALSRMGLGLAGKPAHSLQPGISG